MKRKVYLETSVISYLTARPGKTILGAAHQRLTQAWWEKRFDYELFISQAVWLECAAGDPEAAQRRLAVFEEEDDVIGYMAVYGGTPCRLPHYATSVPLPL
jgi:hypothetical protein